MWYDNNRLKINLMLNYSTYIEAGNKLKTWEK